MTKLTAVVIEPIDITIGMPRAAVIERLGTAFMTLEKTQLNPHETVDYEAHGLTVYYNQEQCIDSIEVRSPSTVRWGGESLLPATMSAVHQRLRRHDSFLVSDESDLFSEHLGVAVVSATSAPDSPVERILLFETD